VRTLGWKPGRSPFVKLGSSDRYEWRPGVVHCCPVGAWAASLCPTGNGIPLAEFPYRARRLDLERPIRRPFTRSRCRCTAPAAARSGGAAPHPSLSRCPPPTGPALPIPSSTR